MGVCVWPKICMYSLASQYCPKEYLTTIGDCWSFFFGAAIDVLRGLYFVL